MKTNSVPRNPVALGNVTPDDVRIRAGEIAVINGRPAHEASKADLEQARRELTGGLERDPKEAVLESAPESERWDPLPGSKGTMAHVTPSVDEDEDGRSDNEILVEKGLAGAEHDQMFQAAKAGAKEGR